jgi:hypothetical protein
MEKFVKKLVVIDGKLLCCWLWTAGTDWDGYGVFHVSGKSVRAHRWSYQHFVGPIPVGKQLDHYRCWTPGCVNPDHLRPATPLENIHNGRFNELTRTHCPSGHPYSGDNLMVKRKTVKGRVYAYRVCRECNRRDSLARYHAVGKSRRQAKRLAS